MTREIGPREKAAQERREAAYAENQKRMKAEAKVAEHQIASTLTYGGLDAARLARSKRLLAEAEKKDVARPKRRKAKK